MALVGDTERDWAGQWAGGWRSGRGSCCFCCEVDALTGFVVNEGLTGVAAAELDVDTVTETEEEGRDLNDGAEASVSDRAVFVGEEEEDGEMCVERVTEEESR